MNKAAVFLGITFGLSWPVALVGFGSGPAPYSALWLVVAVYFMFTPLISTLITQKLIFRKELMNPLRVSFRLNRWFLVALLLPAGIAIGATATSLLFAGVSLTADPTRTSVFLFLAENFTPEQVARLTESIKDLPIHPFFAVLLGGTIAGLTINGVAGFGEELGWRGLLLRQFAHLGFWRSSLSIGLIWGIWHLPFIIHGHNYPGHPIAGIFMMILWTTMFSPLINYVTVRADSVIAAAIMHGAVNGTVMAPLLVMQGGHMRNACVHTS